MNTRRWLWIMFGVALGMGIVVWMMRRGRTDEFEEIPAPLEAVA